MYVKRQIEDEIEKWIDAPEIIAIRGPRQSGKTTLVEHIKELISKKNKNIHFISFESPLDRDKFEKDPEQYIKSYMKEGKNFFLFDEVQYVKEAGKILKFLFDKYKNIKFIITGSSTLDLNKVGSYLVGRVIFFELRTFSFEEFLRAKNERMYTHYLENKINYQNPKITKSIFIDDLNKYLREYIKFGGYPRVVLEEDEDKKKTLLKNIFTTYVEKDIVNLYGINNKDKIISAVKFLSSTIGNIIKYEKFCDITSLHNKEAKEILSILENTYIIKRISSFHKNLVTELRKNPKIYFLDFGMRNIIVDKFEFLDEEFGHLIENFMANIIKDPKFWRTTSKAEVDFIAESKGEIIPIEVKQRAKMTTSFRSFINSYSPKIGVIVNMNESGKEKINGTEVYFVPICLVG